MRAEYVTVEEKSDHFFADVVQQSCGQLGGHLGGHLSILLRRAGTDALGFENASYRLIRGDLKEAPKPEEHVDFPVHAKNLRDICRIREF